MATLTEQPDVLATPAARRPVVPRFLLAFAFGLLAVFAIVAGAVVAFEASYEGRILPGVHVGAVDVAGLSPESARERLGASFTELRGGSLVLTADGKNATIDFSTLGRRLDVDGMVDRAMQVGRAGSPAERVAQHVRYAIFGHTVEPAATFDRAALETAVTGFASQVDVAAKDASVSVAAGAFKLEVAATGRAVDTAATVDAAALALSDIRAPSTITVPALVADTQPGVDTGSASRARQAAVRVARDITLAEGKDTWTIPGKDIRGWITFGLGADGTYGPVVAREGLQASLAAIAKKVERKPVDAGFLLGKGDQVVGVTQSKNGRALDVDGTLAAIDSLIRARVAGSNATQLGITALVVAPKLTTEEAQKTAPLMEPVSEWTTYFPWGDRNGFGANIWIPARDLDGTVVMPGQKFDFWRSIGPVTRQRGYKDGGAIINGRTEPQGALAGGICSTSTTLFNAALRFGLDMGARRNHYYYIDRYPMGLDATVFQSASGSVQTMSWTNDTKYPILIRSKGWRVGTRGYVRFTLWSVPNGRSVSFTKPIIKNVVKARDTTRETTTLKPGVRQRIEYVHDGMDVWVTRVVKDASGKVVHKETFYSHYGKVDGVVLVGVAPTAPPPATTPPPPTT